MDNTREGDLKRLHKRFNDPLLPMSERKKAYKMFTNIQKQMNDRVLAELRQRLIRATEAGDGDAVEKINMCIDEHSARTGYSNR